MQARNNLTDIEGVIFDKPVKKVIGKKGDNKGKEMDIPSLVLEIRGNGNGKEYVELVEFTIGNRSIPLDDFMIGDRVVITYALAGIRWKDGYINKVKAIYIKHADIQGNDTRDLRAQKPAKEQEVFTGAIPFKDDDGENGTDPLPF